MGQVGERRGKLAGPRSECTGERLEVQVASAVFVGYTLLGLYTESVPIRFSPPHISNGRLRCSLS